ncbi:MAG: hypothetical protein GY870_03930 [archaeon]|nr:hypothetical protein [archaeon]
MAAGYTNSLLVNAQAKLAQRFQSPEMRHEPYNLIKAMITGGLNMFIDTELDRIYKSDSMTVDTYVFKKRSVSPGSARAYNHTSAAFGDSQKVTLSFAIVSGTYKISLKMGGRNIFERAEMLANDLMSAQIAINNTIEAAIATYLSTYKNQTNAANGSYAGFGEWNSSDYVWEIPVSAKDNMFQYISEIMAINDYDQPLTVIADPVAAAVAGQLAQQGQANANNLGWQFDNMQIVKSRRVADSSYLGTIYVVPTGTVGMVARIPTQNREGAETKLYTYSSMNDPLGTPMEMAVHEYEAGADNSTLGAETQDVSFQYENSVDYAIVKAPISANSNYSTIFKFGLSK